MKHDQLHELFTRMLCQTENLSETAPQFIRRVAVAYSLDLLRRGDIPQEFRTDVQDDLEAEVLEMYRKTTYGFVSLREYRVTRCRTESKG